MRTAFRLFEHQFFPLIEAKRLSLFYTSLAELNFGPSVLPSATCYLDFFFFVALVIFFKSVAPGHKAAKALVSMCQRKWSVAKDF